MGKLVCDKQSDSNQIQQIDGQQTGQDFDTDGQADMHTLMMEIRDTLRINEPEPQPKHWLFGWPV